MYRLIEAALRTLLVRPDFRVVQFSIQTNHMHLLVEAHGAEALSRGMQALAIRIARGVNRAMHRRGKVWRGRYHARILRSPQEVRLALCYVLQNTRRHATTERAIVDPSWIDPRSSGPWFDGWRNVPGPFAPAAGEAPTAEPRTWLLSTGWRRAGLIRVDEVPSAAFR
jgi:REP element-mobilizing transposase RayT